MEFIDNITKKEYDNFFKKAKYKHFLQSYDWGQICKVRKQIPVYLGMKDEKGNLVAACLAMKKITPLHMCYYYSPRGILIDYDNFDLLKEFTEKLKEYLKKNNAISFKMDPAIMYQEIDEDANPIENGNNNYKLFDELISLGYKHGGFNKLFTKNQPRYTFRLETNKPWEEIEAKISKSFIKTVKRSEQYDLEITDDYDNDTFYELISQIANKDDFSSNSKEFYNEYDKILSKNNEAKYVTIKIYPDKVINKIQTELDKINEDIKNGKINQKHMADANNMIQKFEKDLNIFMPYKNKYPEGLVSLVLVCAKTNNAIWTLYIGNNELATQTFCVNRAYFEAIKYAYDNKLEFIDFFGTVGEPKTTVSNYAGIHEYKRKMGGTYTEFIGEFDLVNKKFWHMILPTLLNIYRKFKK